MSERLTSQMLVSALIRSAQAAGGTAMVLHKGDPTSGAIVVLIAHRGVNIGFLERVTGLSGCPEMVPTGPKDLSAFGEVTQYVERRSRSDSDIWFLELDVANGEQLAAEILCAG